MAKWSEDKQNRYKFALCIDKTRHRNRSRVAEVAGPSKLSYDLSQRRKGMVYAIEQAERGWKKFPDRYQLIQKYVDGVNTALAEWSPANYPLEYKLLNVPPEPWTIKKTIMIVKMMANDLAGRGSDIPATNMLEV